GRPIRPQIGRLAWNADGVKGHPLPTFASTSANVGGSEPLRVQVIAEAHAANFNQDASSLRVGAGAALPSAPSRSIADSRADMKLSPAPTVSTTSIFGAATSRRKSPSRA